MRPASASVVVAQAEAVFPIVGATLALALHRQRVVQAPAFQCAREAVTDEVWKSITTDRHGCLNRACPSYKSCAQMAARKRLRDASVIVANHDLLLADLAMGGGKILPAPEECFYVIDEAHGLPEKAVSSFASGHFINAERRSAEKLANLAASLQDALGTAFEPTCERIHDEADRLRSDLTDAYGFLSSLAQLRPTTECPRPTLEFEDSCLPEEFFEIGENIKNLTNSLAGLLDECQGALNDRLGTDRSKQEQPRTRAHRGTP